MSLQESKGLVERKEGLVFKIRTSKVFSVFCESKRKYIVYKFVNDIQPLIPTHLFRL